MVSLGGFSGLVQVLTPFFNTVFLGFQNFLLDFEVLWSSGHYSLSLAPSYSKDLLQPVLPAACGLQNQECHPGICNLSFAYPIEFCVGRTFNVAQS